MEYPFILIDNMDTPCSSKRINIFIELRNGIIKQSLEAGNEGNLACGTVANDSQRFKIHSQTLKTICGFM